ncbi:MAG TPA: response regulator [Terriglobales bacterium]|nr:response regulator [Terriglobales bacterium]
MLTKRSILLVDDENSILETLRLVFEREGYEVATAKNSTEAVGLISGNGRFDAVITDLNMEEEDIGLEVARAAMKSKPRPAVVICTGFASMANSRAALEMGVDYMAHKPVELNDLISALNRLISRHREWGERG